MTPGANQSLQRQSLFPVVDESLGSLYFIESLPGSLWLAVKKVTDTLFSSFEWNHHKQWKSWSWRGQWSCRTQKEPRLCLFSHRFTSSMSSSDLYSFGEMNIKFTFYKYRQIALGGFWSLIVIVLLHSYIPGNVH